MIDEINLDDGDGNRQTLHYMSDIKVGTFRYLHPKQVEENIEYDYAIIANRAVRVPHEGRGRSCLGASSRHEVDKINSPGMMHEGDQEHRRLVDRLCNHGLTVDIIDGGHSEGKTATSDYFILLLRASEPVIQTYNAKFRQRLWYSHGNIDDFLVDCSNNYGYISAAERIEIVDYIVKHKSKLSLENPWIQDMFPIHHRKVTDKLVSTWFASLFKLSCTSESQMRKKQVIASLKENFGEKVAYYFGFIRFYNQALLPLALAGVVVQIFQKCAPTAVYMKFLPWWGMIVCVIWSFWFLKRWDQENAALQFEWNQKLNAKLIEYRNEYFRPLQPRQHHHQQGKKITTTTARDGSIHYKQEDVGQEYHPARVLRQTPKVDEDDIDLECDDEERLCSKNDEYPAWRRIPKLITIAVFMIFQTVVMLVMVALWVSIYEMLKVKYPDGHIFGTQWLLILAEGIIFGIFVDVIQWNMVVTKMARKFTHWENYRTEEAFERSLIRKLFIMDFLNYYTWFFSLAFVFVIPGVGNFLTNSLNEFFFGDAMNCCFGPYVNAVTGACITCPSGSNEGATCIECTGWFTFDRNHVDLSAMFVTPIVVTQSMNLVIGLMIPMIQKHRRQRAQRKADAAARKRIMNAGSMKILGSLEYEAQEVESNFKNKARARYLEYSAEEVEVLNAKAREILFESEQDSYDPYNDYHTLTVQFGFVVMFSILWPLMPLVCMLINSLKMRSDGVRLVRTLKRPVPRKSNGIGHWRMVVYAFALIAISVNVALICLSTGALEFYTDTCVRDFGHQYQKQGLSIESDFRLGPDYGCLHLKWRLLMMLVLEHTWMGLACAICCLVPRISARIQKRVYRRQQAFKDVLLTHDELILGDDCISEHDDDCTIVVSKSMAMPVVDARETKDHDDGQKKEALAKHWAEESEDES